MKIFLFVLILLFPTIAEGKEIVIKNNSQTNEYVIDHQIYVGGNDVLRIQTGSKIQVTESGSIYSEGKVYAEGIKIFSQSLSPFFQQKGGEINVSDILFEGVSFIEAYSGSNVEVKNLSQYLPAFTNQIYDRQRPVISIFNNSTLSISNTDLSNYSQTSAVTVPRSALIEVYGNSRAVFDDVVIDSCDLWFMVYQNSSITGNVNVPDCVDEAELVFLNSTSSLLYSDSSECCSSVLFIPGIQGSRLYKKQVFENQLWEPNRELDVQKLFLDSNGDSIDSSIYTKHIITKTNVFGSIGSALIYESFINILKTRKVSGEIKEYFPFAYDWRQSPDDVVLNGLVNKVTELARDSKDRKVSIVAHSYGGLVSKSLLLKLKEMNKAHLINKVVLVAVPESGAPQSIFTLLHGHTDSLGFSLLISGQVLQKLALNMPSLYQLLPTRQFGSQITAYFRSVKNEEVKTFQIEQVLSGGLNPSEELGRWLRSQVAGSTPVIKDIFGRQVTNLALSSGSILIASTTNQKLFNLSKNIPSYGLLDQDFKIWSVIGTGIQTNVGMNYLFSPCTFGRCKSSGHLFGVPIHSTNGDGTVIFDSRENRLGEVIKINIANANTDSGTNYKHGDILESKPVSSLIEKILFSTDTPHFAGEEVETIEGYSVGVRGILSGGFSTTLGAKAYKTAIIPDKEGFRKIEQVPNSSITQIGDELIFSSKNEFPELKLQSHSVQQISFFYGNAPVNEIYVTASVNVIPGSILSVDSTGVSVDQEGDGDIDEEIGFVESSNSSTTPTDLATDIESLNRSMAKVNDSVSKLKIASYKNYFGKNVLRLSNFVSRLVNRRDLDNLSYLENKELIDLYSVLSYDVWLIIEFDLFYSNIQNKLGGAIIPKLLNAQSRREDLFELFLTLSKLESEWLEFIGKHGTIIPERLQRP